jgi:manganese transport protein
MTAAVSVPVPSGEPKTPADQSGSLAIDQAGRSIRASFFGPAMLVAVGYMDPGNWATSMAAGSRFGYSMLWVIALSSGLAMLMQAAAARLGLGARLDLAQACRLHFTPAVNLALWVLCEVAIAACCLAEVLGMAIALQLLLHIPLPAGVLLTVFDTFLVLLLLQRGFGRLEAVIVALVGSSPCALRSSWSGCRRSGATCGPAFGPVPRRCWTPNSSIWPQGSSARR